MESKCPRCGGVLKSIQVDEDHVLMCSGCGEEWEGVLDEGVADDEDYQEEADEKVQH